MIISNRNSGTSKVWIQQQDFQNNNNAFPVILSKFRLRLFKLLG